MKMNNIIPPKLNGLILQVDILSRLLPGLGCSPGLQRETAELQPPVSVWRSFSRETWGVLVSPC